MPSKLIKILRYLILVVSFLGFADSAYLTMEHFLGRIPQCAIVSGCETVLTSFYSKIGGIPIALLGTLFYILVFFLVWNNQDQKQFNKFLLLVSLGFIASLGFLYLQVFVLKALCFYCLISLSTSTILWILSMIMYINKQKVQ